MTAGVGVGWLGERPIPLGQIAPPVLLVDAQVAVAWRGIEFAVLGQNLTDARWQSLGLELRLVVRPVAPGLAHAELKYSTGAPLSITGRLTIRFDEAALFGGGAWNAPVAPPHPPPVTPSPRSHHHDRTHHDHPSPSLLLVALALTSMSFAACGVTEGRAITMTFHAQGDGAAHFTTASGWTVSSPKRASSSARSTCSRRRPA